MLATLFHNPIVLSQDHLPWMMLPLCLSVAIVYKTIRVQHLRQLPFRILYLFALIAGGLVLLGAGLWAVQRI